MRSLAYGLVGLLTLLTLTQAPDALGRPARAPQLILQIGHRSYVNAVAFTPDGKVLASASQDKTVKLWHSRTWELLRTFVGHTSGLEALAFSVDGRLLASGSSVGEGAVKLWDVQTGALLRTFTDKESDRVPTLAFSPDGRTLATVNLYRNRVEAVNLWDVRTGALKSNLEPVGGTTALVFSPDGRTLGGNSNFLGVLWDLETRAIKLRLKGHSSSVASIAFSPGGKAVVTASPGDRTVRTWDAQTGEERRVLPIDQQPLPLRDPIERPYILSPDGKLVVSYAYPPGGREEPFNVRVRSTETGKAIQALAGYRNYIRSLAFSPDRTWIASGGTDKHIRVWDLKSGNPLRTILGYGRQPSSIAISSHGRVLVSGHADRTLRLWHLDRLTLARSLTGHTEEVLSVAAAPDGKMLASSDRAEVRLWDRETGAVRHKLANRVTAGSISTQPLTFSPDGQTLASTHHELPRQLPPPPPAPRPLPGTQQPLFRDSIGQFTQPSWHIRLWDTVTGRWQRSITVGVWIYGITFSPDGQRVVGAMPGGTVGGYIGAWDLQTGRQLSPFGLERHGDDALAIAYSPDGKMIASGSKDMMVVVRDIGQRGTRTLQGHRDWVNALAFSPDAKLLASGSRDGTLRLWNPEMGALARTLIAHEDQVNSVSFTSDGKRVISASADGTVKFWDPQNGKLLVSLTLLPPTEEGKTSENWIAYTPEGHYTGSPGVERFIRWRLGGRLLPAENYQRSYAHPDVVQEALRETSLPQQKGRN